MDKLYFVRDSDPIACRDRLVAAPDATRALHLWRSYLFDNGLGEMFDVPEGIFEVDPAGAPRGVLDFNTRNMRNVTAEAGLEGQ